MKELDSFTVEQLNDFIKSDHAQCGDVAALARIALAAKRAEPVAWEVKGILCHSKEEADSYVGEPVPLYEAPQLNSPEMLEGWKLVPIEITKAMRDAWDSAPNGHEDDDVNMCNAYRAMIAAAPEPQTQQQNIPEIIPQGWTSSDPANAALVMLDRIDTIDSADDDRIEDIKLIIRQLAAAPESE
ncbi:TPA: hypothetical protein ACVYFA_000047 [Yersinia enterocolitica]|nr:hypothetical protein [Yersinia enterocolitica]